MTNSSNWRSSEPLWGYHNNRSSGRSSREDLRPPERRFEYMDRMGEAESGERESALQRAEAYRVSLPPVKRDGVVQVGKSRFSVYSGEEALEMRRREAESKRLREGGRR